VDTGCATLLNFTFLGLVTRKDAEGLHVMYFVFRQHKAVADVLHCNDDDKNGNYYLIFEGEARRSLRSELN
jgi:hypothetical protein